MHYRGIEIVCPACKAELREETGDDHRLCCVSCGRRFPVVLGIPDLRLRSDPYIDVEGDRAKGAELAARSAGLDFASSVELYYSLAAQVPASQAEQFKRGLMAAISRAEEALNGWESEAGREVDSLLDVGCGTAPLLVVAAQRAKRVVGIDIAFRWLVMAQKRLAEAALDAPLICAGAEALPFPGGTFERVVADAVLEHVWDQRAALAECQRVMRPAGRLFISTPNRFSLGPDPHVGLWAGGLLPQSWIDTYVRRQGGNPPHRRLLTCRGLQHLLEQVGLAVSRLYLPDVAAGQRAQFGAPMRWLIDLYQTSKRCPGGRQLLLWIGPFLHAVAEKPAVFADAPAERGCHRRGTRHGTSNESFP